MGKQAGQYDKIFRENLEAIIPSLIQNVLGIETASTEELPDDVQHTKERKPDVLKRVTDVRSNTFVLQIEFQLADEPQMVYRMAEYYVMLSRKYGLPIEQFVIFLGSTKPTMPVRLMHRRMQFEFSLISFTDLDYQLFLRSERPEEVVLAVLTDFRGNDAVEVLTQIVQRINETTESDLSLKRHINQLRILTQLRNLELNLTTVMDSIASFFKEEKDFLYIRGQELIINNLLMNTDFSAEKIADLTGVSVDFVRTVQRKLTGKAD
ncbi:hypothetical protein CLV58_10420 [Spirosoma oryzae]|uniref:Uncharacterized protein n=1 Tax=Spirosoma oryzae TaxID=1469603 RepID=A0A2T0TB62_9BACT|nr:hypothetical protein CLV58_10420 [Spirosoma oryzae]